MRLQKFLSRIFSSFSLLVISIFCAYSLNSEWEPALLAGLDDALQWEESDYHSEQKELDSAKTISGSGGDDEEEVETRASEPASGAIPLAVCEYIAFYYLYSSYQSAVEQSQRNLLQQVKPCLYIFYCNWKTDLTVRS